MSTAKLPEPLPTSEEAVHGEPVEATLLLRGIRDEFWVAAIEWSVDDFMRRFTKYGTQGPGYELIRKAIVADFDHQVLVDAIGRGFTSRLAQEIEQGAGIRLDLRYAGMEISKVGSNRFLTFTIGREAASAIYDWNVSQAGLPSEEVPLLATLNKWDWGSWLDSIVRAMNQGERNGVTFYGNLFRKMWLDGFIVKGMVLALRNPNMFREELALQDCTLH